MITSTRFIKNYSSFWKELLPGGTRYIKELNRITKLKKSNVIKSRDRPEYRYITSSYSFALFNQMINETTKLDYINNPKLTKGIYNNILSTINPLVNEIRLNENEVKIIKEISKRLFLKYVERNKLVVKPKFKGCGLLFESEGDLYYGNTLVEIKAGERGFGITDLRQLLIYSTLRYKENPKNKFKFIELYNPRMDMYWRESLDKIILEIAGTSIIEFYNEVINFLSATSEGN